MGNGWPREAIRGRESRYWERATVAKLKVELPADGSHVGFRPQRQMAGDELGRGAPVVNGNRGELERQIGGWTFFLFPPTAGCSRWETGVRRLAAGRFRRTGRDYARLGRSQPGIARAT